MNDDQLLAKFIGGDESAYTAIVARYEKPIKDFIARKYLTRAAHLVDDITQETFLTLFTKYSLIRWGMPLRPWLFCVAGNAAIDAKRAHRRPKSKNRRTAPVVLGTQA